MPPSASAHQADSLAYNSMMVTNNGAVMNRADKQILRARNGYCLECEGSPVLLYNIRKSRINPLWITKEPRSEKYECADGICFRCHPCKDPNQRQHRHGSRISMPLLDVAQRTRSEIRSRNSVASAPCRVYGNRSAPSILGRPSLEPPQPTSPLRHTRSAATPQLYQSPSRSHAQRCVPRTFNSLYVPPSNTDENQKSRGSMIAIQETEASAHSANISADDNHPNRTLNAVVRAADRPATETREPSSRGDFHHQRTPSDFSYSSQSLGGSSTHSSSQTRSSPPPPTTSPSSWGRVSTPSPPPSPPAAVAAPAFSECDIDGIIDNVDRFISHTASAGNSEVLAEIVLGTMREHSERAPVQAYCLRIIWEICKGNDSHKAAMMSNGAPEYILRAMRKFPGSFAVQEKGCGAVWALGAEYAGRFALVRAGACASVAMALKNHIGTESLARTAIGAALALSAELEARKEFKRIGTSKLTVDSMAIHRSSVVVQRDGCAFLSNCAVDIEKQAVNVVSLEELDATVQAMKHHKQDTSVMQGACFALKNYTHEEKNCSTLRMCKDVDDVLMDASGLYPTAGADEIMERLRLSQSMEEAIKEGTGAPLTGMINS